MTTGSRNLLRISSLEYINYIPEYPTSSPDGVAFFIDVQDVGIHKAKNISKEVLCALLYGATALLSTTVEKGGLKARLLHATPNWSRTGS